MSWTNYHSHTFYCDGQNKAEDYIKEAINQDMPAYGYSSHAPVPFFCEWTIPEKRISAYIKDITEIKRKYIDKIQVYVGLEVDYIPNVTGPLNNRISALDLDYTIGSVHFVDSFDNGERWTIDYTFEHFVKGLRSIFKNNVKRAVQRYFSLTREMISTSKPHIIGHLDKIKMYNKQGNFFNENERWYINEVEETLKLVKAQNIIIEINTRGFYKNKGGLSPGSDHFERIKQLDIPVTINSDSHKPSEITKGYKEAAELLKKAGIDELWILFDSNWKPFKYDIVKGISL